MPSGILKFHRKNFGRLSILVEKHEMSVVFCSLKQGRNLRVILKRSSGLVALGGG